MSNLPERYCPLIAKVTAKVRTMLESGLEFPPTAFIGSLAPGELVRVLVDMSEDEKRDDFASAIRLKAKEVKAEFVFLAMEAFAFRPSTGNSEARSDIHHDASIAPPLPAIDIVSMSLETRHGNWMARVPINPKGTSKTKRTIGKPDFKEMIEMTGRLSNFLPANEEAAALPH